MRLGVVLVFLAVAIVVNVIAPIPGAAAQVERKTYRVRQGDSLWTLARRHGTTPQLVARMNGLNLDATLSIGQRLTIPVVAQRTVRPAAVRTTRQHVSQASSSTPTRLYRVRAGDTLWILARRHNTTPERLAAMNRISAGAVLSIGKRLNVPAPARSVRSPAPLRAPTAVRNAPAALAEPAPTADRLSSATTAQAPALRPRPAALPSRGARWSSTVVALSTRFLGVRYVWGGTSPEGFDCSGFMYYVFQRMGITVPRTTYDMFEVGVSVPRDQLQVGDFVFFETLQPGPSHAGIYLGGGRFIHSSSGFKLVTITPMDHRYYGPRYLGARRF